MNQTRRLHIRRIAIILIVVYVLSTVNSAFASPFILRNGIKWYMTKKQVEQCLKSEPDYDSYSIADESVDYVRNRLITFSPYEKTNPKLWQIIVSNLSLGKASEDVSLMKDC